ncbi:MULTISPECIES: single-stranded DNA-binding protein [unclassified Streptococcus]|uniref:single-stranded DNA-binding protein n=1 Tax=unclassified Streptococcus TaxID=2608887 RepID=UPI001071CC9F|nr:MULTISPECIES: single-stranded DNA-binding protein [unclassified Streptococcus]MBF0786945.1 single-stranded DNA-binding protein [Streptococcus sp. 19428wC2_LYSM12]MCQ9211489.1 single-stranded DNA-binding protein [Streptococcus sp. B01]MCQ9214805.1 single-stranded DNA-binding protein [Streptococcus sp. O1]TFV06144.1 single-stranded DNA-binding protein [Streptococcus sp. LYSM12]
MQEFIAYGRVSDIPADALGKTTNGYTSFKFDFVCDSSQLDQDKKPVPSFFHVQVYGKQADVMSQSLSKGSPILIKGEIIQRVYMNKEGQRRTFQYIAPDQFNGITFLESKEAATKRKQAQELPFQPAFSSSASKYPEPIDADEPF